MAASVEVEIVSGARAGERFAIGPQGLRIGRSSSNDVCILDLELSRNHCLVERSVAGEIYLSDLASANGTYRNGQLVGSDPVRLAAGDVITVGNTQMRVLAVSKP